MKENKRKEEKEKKRVPFPHNIVGKNKIFSANSIIFDNPCKLVSHVVHTTQHSTAHHGCVYAFICTVHIILTTFKRYDIDWVIEAKMDLIVNISFVSIHFICRHKRRRRKTNNTKFRKMLRRTAKSSDELSLCGKKKCEKRQSENTVYFLSFLFISFRFVWFPFILFHFA